MRIGKSRLTEVGGGCFMVAAAAGEDRPPENRLCSRPLSRFLQTVDIVLTISPLFSFRIHGRSLAEGEGFCSPVKNRKLQAFRHRGGMGKKGARTAGGASVLLLPDRTRRLAAPACFAGLRLSLALNCYNFQYHRKRRNLAPSAVQCSPNNQGVGEILFAESMLRP
jgi:hypothetical protein